MISKRQIVSKRNLIIIFGVLVCLYILFYIKYSVHNLTYQKQELQKILYKEKENIRILKSELATLSNSNRIKQIVEIYLSQHIKDTNPQQIINENDCQAIKINNNLKVPTSWRYKKTK